MKDDIQIKETAKDIHAKTPGEKLTDRMDRGQKTFNIHCASCHLVFKESTGPALLHILSQWRYDTISLNAFIRNPTKAIHVNKMPRAVKSWKEYKPTMMTAFPNLSNEQLNDIYTYLQYTPTAVY